MHPPTRKRWFVILLILIVAVLAVICSQLIVAPDLAPMRSTIWFLFTDWLCPVCSHKLVASNLPVNLTWEFDSASPFKHAPAISDSGIVLVKTNSTIIALDSKQGQVKWQQNAGIMDEYGVILPYQDSVFLSTLNDSIIRSLRVQDGALNWETRLDEYVQASAPALKPEVSHALYDGTRLYLVIALKRGIQVLALDPSSGELLWQCPAELSRIIGNPFEISVSISDDVLTMISNRVIVKLDAKTGNLLSESPLALDSFRAPLLDREIIYTNGDRVRAIDSRSLQEKWRFENPCSFSGDLVYPRLVSGEVAYVASTCGGLYALDTTDGHTLWEFSAPDRSGVDAMVLFDGLGYAQTDDARLYAIDLATGHIVGKADFKPSGTPPGDAEAFVANDQMILLHFGDRSLFAFR